MLKQLDSPRASIAALRSLLVAAALAAAFFEWRVICCRRRWWRVFVCLPLFYSVLFAFCVHAQLCMYVCIVCLHIDLTLRLRPSDRPLPPGSSDGNTAARSS